MVLDAVQLCFLQLLLLLLLFYDRSLLPGAAYFVYVLRAHVFVVRARTSLHNL